MFKLTLEQILASIELLNPEEKQELRKRLPAALCLEEPPNKQSGQFMTSRMGNVEIGGNNTAFNYQPSQAGGDVNTSAGFTQGTSEQKELIQTLLSFKEAIENTESLPELSKLGAKAQADQLAIEAQKENPDKSLIERTVSALKQGLQGITELAGPLATVSSLVAKAWGIPV
jgi:hypothetical protein